MGIGSRLKEAREANSISLDSLQDTTKIQKRYLVAIEEENFKILPGKFYARAFIKEYAYAVGLNPDELMEEYKDDIPSPEDDNGTQYTRIQRSRKDNSPAKSSAVFSLIPTLIVVLLVIGIIFAAWYFLIQKTSTEEGINPDDDQNGNEFIRNPEQNNEDEANEGTDDSVNEDEHTEEDPDKTEESVEEPDKAELDLVETGTGNKPESTYDLNNAGDETVFVFESEGASWLDVENEDGKSFYSGNFSAKDSPMELTISDEEKVYLNIGSAPNLQVTINGIELDYPVDPDEYVVQRFWIHINQETE